MCGATTQTILVVVPGLGRGGTETHLARTLPGLRREGFDVRLFSLRGGEMAAEFAAAGVPMNAPGRFWPLNLLRLVWLLFTARPALVHFYLPMAYVLGAPLALLAGRRCAMSRRSLNDYQRAHPFAAWVERRLHRRMAALTGNAQAVMRQLAEEGAPAARLRLIYNGIALPEPPTAEARAEKRRELGLAPGSVAFVIAANLIPYKGHADLIAACGLLAARTDAEWTVLCAGRDSAGIRIGLERQAAALGIADRLRFLGGRSDMAEILAACDAGILCSHEEGFSNAVLEGMAAGLPMLVTDVGGNAEAVENGVCGLVAPPRDPEALAAGMAALLDPAARARLGAAAQARAAERFGLSACIAAHAALYRELQRDARSLR